MQLNKHYIQTHAHIHTHANFGGYQVKNRTWMFQGSNEFRGDISSSGSPQGHSLQAAAVAAITALHLPAPFNWLMLFDMSEQSSQLASGKLQLGPGLNAAENFAKPWYEVTARLKSIRRTWLKAAVLHPMLTGLLGNSEMGESRLSEEGGYAAVFCWQQMCILERLNSPQVLFWGRI